MNKMAIFVEGYTELIFINELIEEIANENAVLIEWRQIKGGTTCPRWNQQIKAAGPNNGQEHFIVIHDCGGDSAVKSRMMQEYSSLAVAGYSKILCIRDVFPKFTHSEIPKLERHLRDKVKTAPITVDFILSIMEIEAWFLSEHSHFPEIDPAITLAAIIANLHFDPSNDDMELRLNPAVDMVNCYAIGGKTYAKGNAKATVDELDFEEIYFTLVTKFPYLKKLCDTLAAFLVE